jgi:hypothetical protein
MQNMIYYLTTEYFTRTYSLANCVYFKLIQLEQLQQICFVISLHMLKVHEMTS